jgi:hypothetical protein
VYLDPVSTTKGDHQLLSDLKLAGHKIQVVEGSNDLEHILRSAKYDLILADLSNAVIVNQRLESGLSRPVFLPVMHQATKGELEMARKQYGFVLTVPGKTGEYLATIEQAMKAHAVANRS